MIHFLTEGILDYIPDSCEPLLAPLTCSCVRLCVQQATHTHTHTCTHTHKEMARGFLGFGGGRAIALQSLCTLGSEFHTHSSLLLLLLFFSSFAGVEFEEIDLSEEPNRGEEMVKLSGGVKTLPQLHVDTRVRILVW